MPRMIFYELKKILSLPVLILLAASVCILAAAPLSRYGTFQSMNGLPPAEYRALTMEYAGPLNRALADRATADWRKLPDPYTAEETPEELARRRALEALEEEYAAIPEAAEAPKNASWDAAQRLKAAYSGLAYPPFLHGYYEGWRAWFQALDAEGAWLCAALLAFGLSGLFSGEAASGMGSLLRTARHGRQALTAAKLTAAGLYGLFTAALCALLPLALAAALFGMEGGQLPAQYAAKVAYPFTLAGYGSLRLSLYFLGALGMAAVMALLSAALPSVTAPAVTGFALFLAPVLYTMLKLHTPLLDSVMRYLPSRFFLPEALLQGVDAAMLWQQPLWPPQWLGMLWAALIPLLCLAAAAIHLRTLREEPIIQE